MQQESQLTTVSEGSISGGEMAEVKEKMKGDTMEQSEETVAFVVRVGENEEDLDYDIKNASLPADRKVGEEKELMSCNQTVSRLVYLRVGVEWVPMAYSHPHERVHTLGSCGSLEFLLLISAEARPTANVRRSMWKSKLVRLSQRRLHASARMCTCA